MFVLVHEDKPIYEINLGDIEMNIKEYFLIHAALDNIELSVKQKRDYFLGQVKSDDLVLYAFVNSVRKYEEMQKLNSY